MRSPSSLVPRVGTRPWDGAATRVSAGRRALLCCGHPGRRYEPEVDIARVESIGVFDTEPCGRFHRLDPGCSRDSLHCRLEPQPLRVKRTATFTSPDPNGR